MAPPSVLTWVGDAGVHTPCPLQMVAAVTMTGVPLPPGNTVAVARALHTGAGDPISTPHGGTMAGGGEASIRGRRGNARETKSDAVYDQVSQASTEPANG